MLSDVLVFRRTFTILGSLRRRTRSGAVRRVVFRNSNDAGMSTFGFQLIGAIIGAATGEKRGEQSHCEANVVLEISADQRLTTVDIALTLASQDSRGYDRQRRGTVMVTTTLMYERGTMGA